MSNEPVLSVLFLWHQHQPFYKDPLNNRYELPWVRLHASKDYYDMVALLDEFPKIRLNFNLVPSLLQQLDDYGEGKAQERFLTLSLKPAQDLAFDDRIFILNNFFMANWDNMIEPYPRYRELLEKRGRIVHGEDMARIQNYFKEQDWRDLQVWFNLTWFDPYWTTHNSVIQALREKGKNFTEDDKKSLIAAQLKICAEVAPKHREVQDRGQIELTSTPFYHPILPLLCDTNAARMALSQGILPQHTFAHPEDARAQIQKAMQDYERRFGQPLQGMWPSEGSVSEAVAEIFMHSGVKWIATDEAILAQSLPPNTFTREDIYEPYRFERDGKSLSFFFRDHELSDAIGFVYTSWEAQDAVADFMKRLHGIRERLIKKDGDHPRPHVVPVILDGENCWEYYKEDGGPFLRGLYKALSEDPSFQTVRANDYLTQNPPTRNLTRIWSGSWINANFAIWIGHREDNQAWDLLYRTRQFLLNYLTSHPERVDSPEAQLAWESIYIAEGSDWCWWYGEDHSSANDETFDYLFRKHLMNVYASLGVKIPEDLRIPIKPKKRKAEPQPPLDFITPRIDGRVSGYFEWRPAGVYATEPGGTGTMHRAQNFIETIYYGYDIQNLYFRLDLAKPLQEVGINAYTFRIIFSNPAGCEAILRIQNDLTCELTLTPSAGQNPNPIPLAAAQKIIEFAVPLSGFATKVPVFDWVVTLEKDGLELEQWPSEGSFSYPYPSEENFAQSWTL